MSTSVQNDFYLYLVNRIGDDGALQASCKLPSIIDLSRYSYEISLVEIQLPSIWHNVYDAAITIWALSDPDQQVRMIIPDGNYKNFDAIVRTVKRLGELVKYKLANKLFNSFIKFGKTEAGQSKMVIGGGIGVSVTPRLMEIFGLEEDVYTNVQEVEERLPIKPDVDLWQYSLIAACNVVPFSSVGDYAGRVLRVFSPQRNDISSINVREIYLPVVANMLDEICVTIHDMKGHQLVFESDEMIILVHLKKVI